MKKILLLFILVFGMMIHAQEINSKIIKGAILGKPKYVKEYVLFLNDSRPFTFMSGDNEYGHATLMTPENLRSRMLGTWFETDFCRYINNEVYYDKNKNITKEIWYYKSGELIDDYDYTYDNLNRLITKKSANKYSKDSSQYFYEGKNKSAKFIKHSYQWKDNPIERSVKNLDSEKPLFITKFDSISKTDSIFAITNDIWKKIGELSYTSAKDSIYYKKLSRIKIYNNDYKVIEEKDFKIDEDYENKRILLMNHVKYEYDSLGRIKKETYIQDDKYHYFVLEKNGKYHQEIKERSYASISETVYEYYGNGNLKTRTHFNQGNVSNQIQFVYKNNHIEKIFYLDTWGKNKKDLKPTEIIFKYTFDKQKNWTEVIKNVDGKDLYKWVREIQYY
ncbi:hypothetical protein ACFQO9_19275 [Chryseobacterium zhengzhouense]|uniref:Sugar-binding protein n=1 Tax=Chryseobacterium zhengzhouense TaxID=1636086 RepID=A0ABW2M4R0_9FLAO